MEKHHLIQCRLCQMDKQRIRLLKTPFKILWRDAKRHARTKGLDFTITEQDLIEINEKQGNKCAISGLSFGDFKPSLDKIDASGGYTKDNIQLTTIDVNKMKGIIEHDRFIELCKIIAIYNQ